MLRAQVSLNRFSYAVNNPVSLTDRSGLTPNGPQVLSGFASWFESTVLRPWAAPAYAPAPDDEMGDLDSLVDASAGVTGSALPYLERAEQVAGIAALVMSGRRGTPLRLDSLSRSAALMDRSGLTVAGRNLMKHTWRTGSRIPAPSGNPAAVNAAAQELVDDILTAPGGSATRRTTGRFGPVVEIRRSDGVGVRYSDSGDFLHFVE
jgi:hypothetical protein